MLRLYFFPLTLEGAQKTRNTPITAGAALAERGHLCGLTGVPHKQLSRKDWNQLML